jgi:hypothetical protein
LILKILVEDMHMEMKAFADALVYGDRSELAEKFLSSIRKVNTESFFSLPKGGMDCSELHQFLDELGVAVLNGTGVPDWSIAKNLRPNQRTVYSIPSSSFDRLQIGCKFTFNVSLEQAD